MRTRLGCGVALAVAAAVLVPGPIAYGGSDPTTPTSTTSTTTTTTIDPAADAGMLPGPATVSGTVTIGRGTQVQLTPTVPPPPTTTTTIPPPSDQLPVDSGEGRRAVYSKSLQRTWTVEADGTVSRTYLVSGRLTWNQPTPDTYYVFSRSGFTCNIKNPSICWRYMVRFTKGPDGDNIGFHEIPKVNGKPIQSESQLGQALSGGCVRQATPDAQHMWAWAPIGTKVVV
ncbi:MAG: L,D-transpeptidase, partial [Ilumatobacteraceae bacterium]